MTASEAEDGVVALEAGLVLPLVAVLLLALLAVGGVVADHLAVARAARSAARTLAVTGDRAAAVRVATGVVPDARVRAVVRSGTGTVEVELRGSLLGVAYDVDATAVAPLEPAVR